MAAISGKEVLIADDNDDIRNVLADFFSFNGYETDTARNGDEALKILKEKPYSLLITDLNMPTMDGIELIRAVRNLGMPLTIIGMSMKDKKHECLKAGADYFLLKPFNFLYMKSILNLVFSQ
jgi:DNA-binding response OmpR family regulator